MSILDPIQLYKQFRNEGKHVQANQIMENMRTQLGLPERTPEYVVMDAYRRTLTRHMMKRYTGFVAGEDYHIKDHFKGQEELFEIT